MLNGRGRAVYVHSRSQQKESNKIYSGLTSLDCVRPRVRMDAVLYGPIQPSGSGLESPPLPSLFVRRTCWFLRSRRTASLIILLLLFCAAAAAVVLGAASGRLLSNICTKLVEKWKTLPPAAV